MSRPLIWSVVLHVALAGATMIAVPHTLPDRVVNEPFPVEIVEVDLMTQTDQRPKPQKREEQPEPPKPETVDTERPPDLLTPQVPEEVAEPVPPPPEEKLEEPEPKPQPEPPPPKPVTKKVEEKPEQDFQSLLKNLMPDDSEDQNEAPQEQGEDEAPSIDEFANKLTISEEDALRAQLARCWNVMAGAKYAEDLVVVIRAEINPDRTVRRAMIADQLRYNQDTHFRAAAEAALRALRNPNCSPLSLPPEKFEQWKTMTIRFDPREML